MSSLTRFKMSLQVVPPVVGFMAQVAGMTSFEGHGALVGGVATGVIVVHHVIHV